MDTSSPAVFANAELIKMYTGRRVRAVVQVIRNEGGVLVGKSTDGQQLTVKGSPAFPLSHFVEVIGIADGNQSIRAEISTDLGENFDAVAYDGLCQLANGKHRKLFL
ncbi:replication protein A 14 kDa subunit-like isoform X2 [Dioscorea cayenensis subsp. rotundata]|nr:replication protein A 14 kDa subunit-like isoform X2 [Dioscorea cayenensis subsp. rotundata]